MRLVQPGEPAVLRVTLAKEEMGRGDRLLPAPPAEIISYAPHRPEQQIAAKVMSIYGGVNEGGPGFIVSSIAARMKAWKLVMSWRCIVTGSPPA
jgi:hypothetical protein